MPVQPTYPGVYVEELSSGVHTITGVATSITAFIGRALRGPVNEPVTINSYAEFERTFGPLWLESSLGYAVRDFYLNGGSKAVIVRLFYPTKDERKKALEAAEKVLQKVEAEKKLKEIVDHLDEAVREFSERAAKEAAQSVAEAVKNKANPTPDSVRCAAEEVADSLKEAADAVAKVTVGDSASKEELVDAIDDKAKNDFPEEPKNIAAQLIVKAAKDAANVTKDNVRTAAENTAAAIIAAVDQVIATPVGAPTAKQTEAQALADAMSAKAKSFATEAEKKAAEKVAEEAEKEANPTIKTVKQVAEVVVAGRKSTKEPRAQISLADLPIEAAYEGTWGQNLRASIDFSNIQEEVAVNMRLEKKDLFNLSVTDTSPGGSTERFRNLSLKKSARRIDKVLEAESHLVRWVGDGDPLDVEPKLQAAKDKLNGKAAKDKLNGKTTIDDDVKVAEQQLTEAKKKLQSDKSKRNGNTTLDDAVKEAEQQLTEAKDKMGGTDGEPISASDFKDEEYAANKKGLYALEEVDLFNMLCIPPYGDNEDVGLDVISEAAAYCEKRRAILIVDPPSGWKDKTTAIKEFMDSEDKIGTRSRNAALFFPRLKQANPLRPNQVEEFVPCGAVAGVIARTDTERGVWKAPAGIEASLKGVRQLSVNLTDDENGELNPLGINCLRSFPIYGPVVWGARTLHGADQFADEYKYLPVRRLALYIEESLYRGLKWVVFEPNDEPLWAQIRLNAGAFMHNLFRQGAFQGQTPREAYLVKCDRETTTQNDINLGIVNILIAFAPLKPAEFVIIKLQQLAGQIEV